MNGLRARKTELIEHLKEHKPDFVTLNETKVLPKHKVSIPGYESVRKDRSAAGGGVAILIKKEIAYSIVYTDDINAETVAITFKQRDKEIALATVYNPPGKIVELETLKHLTDKYEHCIITGDFNSKHAYFGNDRSDSAGDALFNITEELDLTILNDESVTFCRNYAGNSVESILDLALASRKMGPKVAECTVKGDVGSDHLPVHIRLNSHEVEKALTKAVHRLDKANWQKFRKELKSIEMGDLTTPEEIEKAVELLETSMICALDKSCQSVKQKTQDFFISEKTSKLIREKRKARRLAMRFSDEPEYMTMYKSLTNEVKESIKTDKERAWQEQIDKLDGARDGTEFWNSFFRLTGAKSRGTRKTPLMRSDGTHTENDKERADTFAASLEKVHNVHQGTIFDDEFKVEVESTIKEHEMLFKPLISHVPEEDDDHETLTPITTGEIKAYLKKCKSSSAPGLDGIRYGVLKQANDKVYEALAQICNACMATGYYPKLWKKAEGIMIPKPGKDGKMPGNYRPISLLSCMGKLFEKTLAGRIRNFLEKEKFFNKWQNGFRSKRIAMEHVFRLVEETQLGFTKKWKGGAIFIDVEKAFDSVWHDGLRYKLMNGSLPRKMVRLISSFLSDRTIKVNCCNNCSEEVTLNAGTPQGSVLSPLLFIIYVNDIPDMSSLNVKLSQFADDMGIWAHATNAKWVKAKLSKALKLIEAWCSKWRIKLNAGKTQLIVFSVGPKPELIDLELFGEPIIQTQTAKLLGILFDRRLSFKDHMKDLMTKVYRRLNLLKLLKGTNWGARPYTILKAYKCFIRPVLEYGSLITGALRESQVKEMQIFQNKCLRLALGVTYLDRMRTIDLHDLTNVPMIKTRMTAMAVKTFRSLENTQCFKDLVLNHEIVQKRSGSNTILDQLLAEIQADA